MPIYCYACADGHVTDHFTHSASHRPRRIRCDTCGRSARYHFGLSARGQCVVGDLQEGYNVSLDRVVKSRRHLNDIRAEIAGETGVHLQDYERVKDRQAGTDLARKSAAAKACVPDNLILGRPLPEDDQAAQVLE